MLDVIRFSGNVLLLRKKEHITDCADDDTAGIDDHPQSDIGGRYRRREKEQRSPERTLGGSAGQAELQVHHVPWEACTVS